MSSNTTTIPPTSTTSNPSSSTSTAGEPTNQTTSSTLYLFTFLATLFVLLLISSAIILRSYVLRRRFRQRYERALAAGLFVDLEGAGFGDLRGGLGGGQTLRGRRRLGRRPVMWETWLVPAEEVVSSEKQPAITREPFSWSSIMPVSLRLTRAPSPPSSPPSAQQQPTQETSEHSTRLARLLSPFSRRRASSGLAASPANSNAQLLDPSSVSSPAQPRPVVNGTVTPSSTLTPNGVVRDGDRLSVCVLVAMPDASAPTYGRYIQEHPPTPPSVQTGNTNESRDVDGRREGKGKDPASLVLSGYESAGAPREGVPLVEFGVLEMNGPAVDEPEGGKEGAS